MNRDLEIATLFQEYRQQNTDPIAAAILTLADVLKGIWKQQRDKQEEKHVPD